LFATDIAGTWSKEWEKSVKKRRLGGLVLQTCSTATELINSIVRIASIEAGNGDIPASIGMRQN
jgi:hypothetical protein